MRDLLFALSARKDIDRSFQHNCPIALSARDPGGTVEQSTEVLRLRDNDIVWRSVEDAIVVLHRREWQYLTVNEAGRILWMRLVDGGTRRELVLQLVSEYGIDESRAWTDVDSFLELLSECDLLAAGEGNDS